MLISGCGVEAGLLQGQEEPQGALLAPAHPPVSESWPQVGPGLLRSLPSVTWRAQLVCSLGCGFRPDHE